MKSDDQIMNLLHCLKQMREELLGVIYTTLTLRVFPMDVEPMYFAPEPSELTISSTDKDAIDNLCGLLFDYSLTHCVVDCRFDQCLYERNDYYRTHVLKLDLTLVPTYNAYTNIDADLIEAITEVMKNKYNYETR